MTMPDKSNKKDSFKCQTAYIGIVRDTTERKQIEASMIEKQHQLAELNLSLSACRRNGERAVG